MKDNWTWEIRKDHNTEAHNIVIYNGKGEEVEELDLDGLIRYYYRIK